MKASTALFLCFFAAGCAEAASPPAEAPIPPSPRACEEAYEDIARYYEADPERRRPAGLQSHAFLHACRELPPGAQRCLLFSFMQAHTARCETELSHADPSVMRRIAAMTGK